MGKRTDRSTSETTRNDSADASLAKAHSRVLRLLLKAFDKAADARRSVREFAVDLWECRTARVSMTDLRWLISHNYAEHLIDTTPTGARRRRFHRTSSLSFSESSCFILTKQGVKLARAATTRGTATIESNQPPVPPVRSKPRWDGEARELWFGSILVKRFRVQAPNQERILAAFEEDGWPTHIDDPLPPNGQIETKRRLHDTINKLNKTQQHEVLHFRGDGSGKGICWDTSEAAE